MAVQVGNAWNLDRALNSQSYAYKAWVNYNYESNTMGIPADDMKQVTSAWSTEISNWEANYSEDENAYEIDEDDWNAAYDDGKTTAKDETGNDGEHNTWKSGGVGVGTASVGGGAAAVVGVAGGFTKGISFGLNAGTKAFGTSGGQALKGAFMVTAPLSLAISLLYYAIKPNMKEHEALTTQLKETMTTQQDTLATSQTTLTDLSDSIMELAEGAEELNSEYGDEIEDRQKELEEVLELYYSIIERVEAGEPITDEEREILKAIGEVIPELEDELADLQGEASDAVSGVYDEIEGTQEQYDAEAETMAFVEGTTDFAEGFDKATQVACYVEGASQALNAATGFGAAAEALITASNPFGLWALAFEAMGIAGGTMSTLHSIEQFKMAKEIGDAIDVRETTQGVNAETQAIYETSLDNMVTYAEITGEVGEEIDDGTALEDITGEIEGYNETADGVEIPEETPPEEGGEGETTPGATSTPGATTPGTTTTSTPQGGAGAGAGAPAGGVHTTSATAPGGSTGGAPGTSGGNTNTTFGTRTGFGGATASTKGAGAPSPTPNPTPNTNGADAPNNPFATSAPNNPFATNVDETKGPDKSKEPDKPGETGEVDKTPDEVDTTGEAEETDKADETGETDKTGKDDETGKDGEDDPRKKNPFA